MPTGERKANHTKDCLLEMDSLFHHRPLYRGVLGCAFDIIGIIIRFVELRLHVAFHMPTYEALNPMHPYAKTHRSIHASYHTYVPKYLHAYIA